MYSAPKLNNPIRNGFNNIGKLATISHVFFVATAAFAVVVAIQGSYVTAGWIMTGATASFLVAALLLKVCTQMMYVKYSTYFTYMANNPE